MTLLQEFYETTLMALKDAKNDRLWFKTNTKVSYEMNCKILNKSIVIFLIHV